MRLFADENLHDGIGDFLIRSGHSLLRAREAGLSGKPDHALMDHATAQDRVLITGDKDFGALLEFGKVTAKAKVILLRYRLINVERIAKDIDALLRKESPLFADSGWCVVVLEESGYRIHKGSNPDA